MSVKSFSLKLDIISLFMLSVYINFNNCNYQNEYLTIYKLVKWSTEFAKELISVI